MHGCKSCNVSWRMVGMSYQYLTSRSHVTSRHHVRPRCQTEYYLQCRSGVVKERWLLTRIFFCIFSFRFKQLFSLVSFDITRKSSCRESLWIPQLFRSIFSSKTDKLRTFSSLPWTWKVQGKPGYVIFHHIFVWCVVCMCVCGVVCVCVCVSQWKKVPDEWQARQATPAILQVSSSKHNAKKIATGVRGPFHQSITAILTEEKREEKQFTKPTHVAVYLFRDLDQDRSRLVCLSQWKKVPYEWQARQAILAILQVNSSKHNAKKNTRVRGPLSQSVDHCHPYSRKREAVY